MTVGSAVSAVVVLGVAVLLLSCWACWLRTEQRRWASRAGSLLAHLDDARQQLVDERVRVRELELRLYLRPWTQHLPPRRMVPEQRRRC